MRKHGARDARLREASNKSNSVDASTLFVFLDLTPNDAK
jgi:hypothetical protein